MAVDPPAELFGPGCERQLSDDPGPAGSGKRPRAWQLWGCRCSPLPASWPKTMLRASKPVVRLIISRSAIVHSRPYLRQLGWQARGWSKATLNQRRDETCMPAISRACGSRRGCGLAVRRCSFDSVISFTISATEHSARDGFPTELTRQNRRKNGKYPRPRQGPSQS